MYVNDKTKNVFFSEHEQNIVDILNTNGSGNDTL